MCCPAPCNRWIGLFMLDDIFAADRLLRLSNNKVRKTEYFNCKILETVDTYLSEYSKFFSLERSDIINSYMKFIKTYSDDVNFFIKTGKYPFEADRNSSISRIDYNIALMMSIVTESHRHLIMDKFFNKVDKIYGDIAIIGVGSGIELEIIQEFSTNCQVVAFDVELGEFIRERFADKIVIKEEIFNRNKHYDFVIAIELLEHLENPYELVRQVYQSLNDNGQFIATTACNVPQWDHVYNFDDPIEYESEIQKIGFNKYEKFTIEHISMRRDINANNIWYEMTK